MDMDANMPGRADEESGRGAMLQSTSAQVIPTPGYHGFSIKYSPFGGGRFACAASQNYGLKGGGRLYIFQNAQSPAPNQAIRPIHHFDVPDAMMDCAWSELADGQVAIGCVDGSIQLVGFQAETGPGRSLMHWKEHQKEIHGLDWNLVDKDRVASASWDGTIKIWNPLYAASLRTLTKHQGLVYCAAWAPRHSDLLVSAADRSLCLWDLKSPSLATPALAIPRAHGHAVLTVDWNKYDAFQVASGSVDQSIRVWDLRKPASPLQLLNGHYRAVRRIRYSPFASNQLASASYDMSVRVWDLMALNPAAGSYEQHTEFVTGVDFDLEREGRLSSCAWDASVHVGIEQPRISSLE